MLQREVINEVGKCLIGHFFAFYNFCRNSDSLLAASVSAIVRFSSVTEIRTPDGRSALIVTTADLCDVVSGAGVDVDTDAVVKTVPTPPLPPPLTDWMTRISGIPSRSLMTVSRLSGRDDKLKCQLNKLFCCYIPHSFN